MPDCATFDFVCKGKSALSNVAGAAASKVTNGFLDELRKSAVDATTSMLKTLGTFWLKIPSPGLDSRPLIGVQGASDTKGLGGLEVLQSNLAWFTIIAAIVGLILCGARMGITARGEHGAEGAKMLVRLIGVAGAGSAVIAVLVKAGDDFSPWLIEQATGQPFDESAPSLVSNAAMLSMTALLTIILAIVAIFGSLAQVVFMILRGGLLLMLVAVWPLAASMSTTEQGMQWYKKINAYIIAFVLLKPVSAIIYSAGFLLLKGSPGTTGDATTNAITSTLSGLAILGLAGLALPALLRFVTPMMASGSGSLSGGAALGAAVAVGAAVVTMGAGGAAAGGGGASAGGASGGASGAASSGGASGASSASGASGGGSGGATGASGGGGGGGGGPSGSGGGGDPTGGSGGGGGGASGAGAGGGGSSGGAESGGSSGTGAASVPAPSGGAESEASSGTGAAPVPAAGGGPDGASSTGSSSNGSSGSSGGGVGGSTTSTDGGGAASGANPQPAGSSSGGGSSGGSAGGSTTRTDGGGAASGANPQPAGSSSGGGGNGARTGGPGGARSNAGRAVWAGGQELTRRLAETNGESAEPPTGPNGANHEPT